MKYVCLIYANEDKLAALPEEEADAVGAECVSYCESLKANGRCLGSEKLQSVASATTIRVRHGKVSMMDGPFAETKEQLGGFYLIDAKDLNEAIQIASRIPPARLGSVEVRPVLES